MEKSNAGFVWKLVANTAGCSAGPRQWLIVLATVLQASSALACGTGRTDISLKATPAGGYTISITETGMGFDAKTKMHKPMKTFEAELVDNNGLASMRAAMSQMHKSSDQGKLDPAKQKGTISFIKGRAELLQKSLEAAAQKPERSEKATAALGKLGEFRETLTKIESGEIGDYASLRTAYNGLHDAANKDESTTLPGKSKAAGGQQETGLVPEAKWDRWMPPMKDMPVYRNSCNRSAGDLKLGSATLDAGRKIRKQLATITPGSVRFN
ncbi:MAG: hypothetical protein HY078_16300 [Elusimicrobia bacterium]|nr:hypothetical protein [Elusimicrobiota bacterium]